MSYLSRVGRSGRSTGDRRKMSTQLKNRHLSVVLKLTIFLWTRVYSFASIPADFFRWMNMRKSKEDKTVPKSKLFLNAGIMLYRLWRKLGNMICLFQSTPNNIKFIKNVQLDSKVNQVKISRKSLRFP